jgi:hypothetical protein
MIVLCVAGILTATSVPLVSHAMERGRVRQSASFVASRFRLARQQALTRSRSVAVVFDHVNGRWTFRVCEDGNGNGLRRAEIAAQVDACHEGPHDIGVMFPGVTIAVDPSVRGPDGEPGTPDPVRFGSSDIASFSSLGTCTAGSLFLMAPDRTLYIVRMAGITGRTRVLRYDWPAQLWRDE